MSDIDSIIINISSLLHAQISFHYCMLIDINFLLLRLILAVASMLCKIPLKGFSQSIKSIW